MKNVLQDWVAELPLMQQTVLLTAIRGPDGVRKHHVSKLVLRWLRRCILISAFDRCVLTTPWDERGGSFTGNSITKAGEEQFWYINEAGSALVHHNWPQSMNDVFSAYIKATDELPHHFQAHVRNAVEILGYRHPDNVIRASWDQFYLRLCDDLHVNPETATQMAYRLGDSEEQWKKAGDRASCGRDECVGAGYDPTSDNPNVAASRRTP